MYMILIGEHQRRLADDLSRRLAGEFLIHLVTHTWQAVESFRTHPYDAVMLDSSLPVAGGFSACHDLRRLGCDSTIFIIGHSDVIEQHEQAFNSGADGYLCTEFGSRDISARISAAIRRKVPNGYINKLIWRDLTLDLEQRSLIVQDKSVRLRPKEFALLQFMMRRPDILFTADQLWHEVWRKNGVASDTVRTHINSVRKKLKQLDAADMIKTMNGLGYKVAP